ncbi:MAG: hypothetical protein EOO77_05465 [Oxalobacteraceae bacterium]|nr:MAG: hypothetical protein EOO77_05465 [Oxalobacteraceae bacterium]
MKSFLTCLCLLLAAYSAWSTAKWWPGSPQFTDLLGQKASADGSIVASYVVQNYGPMAGTTFGLTLSGKQEDPLKAEPILVQGEDDRAIQYEWSGNNRVDVYLPCGWWGRLTNHYQLKGTMHIVDIRYLSPPPGCSRQITSSSALPE